MSLEITLNLVYFDILYGFVKRRNEERYLNQYSYRKMVFLKKILHRI